MTKRKYLSDWNDACPGLLIYILFGYWRFTFDYLCCHRQSPCTCFLYYNLCLCKSFKERAPKGAHQRSAVSRRRRHLLICGCKGTLFPRTDKTLSNFFQKKMHFCPLYIIYYTRARKKWLLFLFSIILIYILCDCLLRKWCYIIFYLLLQIKRV